MGEKLVQFCKIEAQWKNKGPMTSLDELTLLYASGIPWNYGVQDLSNHL